jgi:hypothetical protein
MLMHFCCLTLNRLGQKQAMKRKTPIVNDSQKSNLVKSMPPQRMQRASGKLVAIKNPAGVIWVTALT